MELSTKYGIQSRFIAIFNDNRSIALMNSNEHFKQGFVIDMTCDGIETIFAQVRPTTSHSFEHTYLYEIVNGIKAKMINFTPCSVGTTTYFI